MPRAGLTTAIVVSEAADLADEIGYDALTLTALAARLKVAVPSLYKHVGSLEDLRRGVALMAIGELGSAMQQARAGGADPASDIRALATAYRRYALDHPGRYAATVRAATGDDRESQAVTDATLRPAFEVLEDNGLHGDDLVHAARSLRAALHGFAALEAAGGFGLPQDVERSFEWLVDNFERGLAARADHS